jgi:hypothetical protein
MIFLSTFNLARYDTSFELRLFLCHLFILCMKKVAIQWLRLVRYVIIIIFNVSS